MRSWFGSAGRPSLDRWIAKGRHALKLGAAGMLSFRTIKDLHGLTCIKYTDNVRSRLEMPPSLMLYMIGCC